MRDRIILHEFHEDTDNYEPDYMFTPEQVEEEMRIRDQESLFERIGRITKPEVQETLVLDGLGRIIQHPDQLQKTLDELAGVISNPNG